MNGVDSSAWREDLADGPNAGFFATAIADRACLLEPSIVVQRCTSASGSGLGDEPANAAAVVMQEGTLVDFNLELAISAARLSADRKLPIAERNNLAMARAHGAVLWTQGADFEGREGVQYRAAAAE